MEAVGVWLPRLAMLEQLNMTTKRDETIAYTKSSTKATFYQPHQIRATVKRFQTESEQHS